MKMLYIMQGIPGSGKSTVAQMIANATNGRIFSTDDLWYDDDGTYCFDIDQLPNKHKENIRLATEAMAEGHESVIIDNTNILQRAANPYLIMADLYGYEVQFVRIWTNLDTCLERNSARTVDRQVPTDTIREMAKQMEVLRILEPNNVQDGASWMFKT